MNTMIICLDFPGNEGNKRPSSISCFFLQKFWGNALKDHFFFEIDLTLFFKNSYQMQVHIIAAEILKLQSNYFKTLLAVFHEFDQIF